MKDLINLLEHNKIEYLNTPYSRDGSHKEFVKQWKDKDVEFFTVLIREECLEQKIWEDPKFFNKTPNTHCSFVEEQVRGMLNCEDYDKIWDIVKKHYGEKDTDESRKIIGKEFDSYADAFHTGLYREVEDREMDSWCFYRWCDLMAETKKDDEWEEEEYNSAWELIIKKRYEDEYKKHRKEIYLVRYVHDYTRRHDWMPKGLIGAGRSGAWQTYYVKEDDTLHHITGHSRGSGTRFNHGYMGHAFAELQTLGKPIKSFLLRINSDSELEYKEQHNELVLNNIDLTGNYGIDYDKSKEILKNIKMVSLYRHFDSEK